MEDLKLVACEVRPVFIVNAGAVCAFDEARNALCAQRHAPKRTWAGCLNVQACGAVAWCSGGS